MANKVETLDAHFTDQGGWLRLKIKDVENYIEFDEDGNIILVESNEYTMDVNHISMINQITKDIEEVKDSLVDATAKLNKYI